MTYDEYAIQGTATLAKQMNDGSTHEPDLRPTRILKAAVCNINLSMNECIGSSVQTRHPIQMNI